jgi:hypothetical protein
MSNTIVPYARFLEIRQRRRFVEELARRAVAAPTGDATDAQPVTIDDAALGDDHCGTRTAPATSGAEDGLDREQARTDVRSRVRSDVPGGRDAL